MTPTLTHPDTYYDAKRLAREAMKTSRGLNNSLGAGSLDDVLTALGWPVPEPDLDGKRKIRVFTSDVYYRLPEHLRDKLPELRRNHGRVLRGFVVAASKKEAAPWLNPPWVAPSKITQGIGEVEPRDYRYRLAIDHPGHLIAANDEFGDYLAVPFEELG